jgi:hypothetical protein
MTTPVALRWLLALVALTFTACAMPAAAPIDQSRVAAVGRISDIEVQHGYLVVEFPSGRMNVSIDKRLLEHYRVGDQLAIDSYGRPLN